MEILPPANNLVNPLLTDLYQITMAYGYWKTNRHNEHAVFELFFRKNPFKGSYTIFCGIDEILKYVSHFKFEKEHIEYLKSVPALSHCENEFFEYLSKVNCSQVKIQSVAQGSVVFPRVPLLIVSGPMLVVQLLETTMLNLVNYPSLVATNASRMVVAARGQFSEIKVQGKTPVCMEFGLRRAQGPDGGMSASKYCMVGGFDAVANVLAGFMYDLKISGTHAHSFVMSFSSLDEVSELKVKNVKNGSSDYGKMVNLSKLVLKYRQKSGWMHTHDGELAAFIAYGIAFPSSFLCLVDTYDTIKSGVKNFILVALALADCGYVPLGVRLDSGDLAALSLKCHELYHQAAKEYSQDCFNQMGVVASNDINEKTLHELNRRGHGITAFGIGTNLVTCQAQPALGCVFKLVELNGKARIKMSNDAEKVLIPGQKRAFRLYNEDDIPQMDLLIEAGETVPLANEKVKCYHPFFNEEKTFEPSRVEEILQTVWDEHGAREILNLSEARDRCINAIKKLDPDMFLSQDPLKYNIYVSGKLQKALSSLLFK